jgi:MYXO-CTERM domain-containing protein
VAYTPEAGYVGTDSAQITWTDPFGQSAVQEVDITVVDAPVVVPPPAGTDPTPQPTAPAAPSTGTDGATGSGVLATTGVEITGLIGLALGLLVVGGLLARRRRREAVPVEVEVED